MSKIQSVNIDDDVYEFLIKMNGKSVSRKFNNLVKFCMTREEMLYYQEQELLKRIKEKEITLELNEQLIPILEKLRNDIDTILIKANL
jgi:hypothetical protein